MDVSNIVRSVVIGGALLPLSLSVSGTLNATTRTLDNLAVASTPSESEMTVEEVRASLTQDCLKFILSKNDSKLERAAQNAVDEYFGGEVNHREVCKWVL